MEQEREIGPIGTASRLLVGLFALYLAFVDGPPFADGFAWDLRWYDALLGLIVLPAIMVGFGLVARRRVPSGVRFTEAAGIALNLAVIVALVGNPYTAPGALLFYGTMMLIAAARGQAGCEGTVLSNWILRRNDRSAARPSARSTLPSSAFGGRAKECLRRPCDGRRSRLIPPIGPASLFRSYA